MSNNDVEETTAEEIKDIRENLYFINNIIDKILNREYKQFSKLVIFPEEAIDSILEYKRKLDNFQEKHLSKINK